MDHPDVYERVGLFQDSLEQLSNEPTRAYEQGLYNDGKRRRFTHRQRSDQIEELKEVLGETIIDLIELTPKPISRYILPIKRTDANTVEMKLVVFSNQLPSPVAPEGVPSLTDFEVQKFTSPTVQFGFAHKFELMNLLTDGGKKDAGLMMAHIMNSFWMLVEVNAFNALYNCGLRAHNTELSSDWYQFILEDRDNFGTANINSPKSLACIAFARRILENRGKSPDALIISSAQQSLLSNHTMFHEYGKAGPKGPPRLENMENMNKIGKLNVAYAPTIQHDISGRKGKSKIDVEYTVGEYWFTDLRKFSRINDNMTEMFFNSQNGTQSIFNHDKSTVEDISLTEQVKNLLLWDNHGHYYTRKGETFDHRTERVEPTMKNEAENGYIPPVYYVNGHINPLEFDDAFINAYRTRLQDDADRSHPLQYKGTFALTYREVYERLGWLKNIEKFARLNFRYSLLVNIYRAPMPVAPLLDNITRYLRGTDDVPGNADAADVFVRDNFISILKVAMQHHPTHIMLSSKSSELCNDYFQYRTRRGSNLANRFYNALYDSVYETASMGYFDLCTMFYDVDVDRDANVDGFGMCADIGRLLLSPITRENTLKLMSYQIPPPFSILMFKFMRLEMSGAVVLRTGEDTTGYSSVSTMAITDSFDAQAATGSHNIRAYFGWHVHPNAPIVTIPNYAHCGYRPGNGGSNLFYKLEDVERAILKAYPEKFGLMALAVSPVEDIRNIFGFIDLKGKTNLEGDNEENYSSAPFYRSLVFDQLPEHINVGRAEHGMRLAFEAPHRLRVSKNEYHETKGNGHIKTRFRKIPASGMVYDDNEK